MESIAVTPDNFETEVLKSDKPVLVVLLPINYGDESDPSDDSVLLFDIPLEQFKSEVQKIVGDQYKIVLADMRYELRFGMHIIAPPIYPPPLKFSAYEKGKQLKEGFVYGYSKDKLFQSLKEQLLVD